MAVFHHQILTVAFCQRKPQTTRILWPRLFGFKKLRSRPRGYVVGAIWGHVAVLLGDASFGGGLSGRRWGPGNTLPETNISPLKIDPWKRRFLLETTIFRGYVSFRQGRIHPKSLLRLWLAGSVQSFHLPFFLKD